MDYNEQEFISLLWLEKQLLVVLFLTYLFFYNNYLNLDVKKNLNTIIFLSINFVI